MLVAIPIIAAYTLLNMPFKAILSQILHLKHAKFRYFPYALLYLMGFFVFNAFYTQILLKFVPADQFQASYIIKALKDLPDYRLFAFTAVILAPIAEEIFYRGFFQAILAKYLGFNMAAIVASLIFAFAHFIPTTFVSIFVLGLILSHLLKASKSIVPGIFMHMALNSISFLALYLIEFF